MKAWYLDDRECRCTLHILRELGVMYWFIPLDSPETSGEMLDQIKSERCYTNEDEIEVSEAKMGSAFEQKLEVFFSEHSHDDEEIRLVLEGEGYFDVRDSADMWVRIHVTRGDLIVLPKGIFHRFTVVPETKRIVARRLFQNAPLWEAKNRFEERGHPQEVGGVAYGPETLHGEEDPREIIPDICKQFYDLGWVSGTGGGMAVRHGNRLFMAPSGVMKERLTSKMMFVLDNQGTTLECPVQHPRLRPFKLSECAPLFMHAFNLRNCGAVLHSHSLNVVMATLLDESADELVLSHQEMIKGVSGHRFDEQLVLPIIENTPRESNLADLLASAIQAYPRAPAVLVRRHGIYVWGNDWRTAKTTAECIDYLCSWACRMHSVNLNPAANPFTAKTTALIGNKGRTMQAWRMDKGLELSGCDQRHPMKQTPNKAVSGEELAALGVTSMRLDADKFENDPQLDEIRKRHGYSFSDIVLVSPSKLPNYESKIKAFFEEHLHTDDEIRYILDGSGYFDVRSKDDDWIRIHMKKGDMITLPAGIYHRFTCDERNYIKAMRLFVGEPVWTAHNRSSKVDAFPERAAYRKKINADGSSSSSSSSSSSLSASNPLKRTAAAAPTIGDYIEPVVTKVSKIDNSGNIKQKKYSSIVLDIEGTTTPISFVKDILFPYASDKVESYLTSTWDSEETQKDVEGLVQQAASDKADTTLLSSMPGFQPPPTSSNKSTMLKWCVENVLWQIRFNRKTGSLKQLQGHIWRAGYASGELKGQVYDDVVPCMEQWVANGAKIFIYSSGSRQAQRLIFGYSDKGDLKKYISGYFDTNIGAKVETSSYRQILETVGDTEVLFLTDLLPEAQAARAAGMDAVLMLRQGNTPLPLNHGFQTANTFFDLFDNQSDKQ